MPSNPLSDPNWAPQVADTIERIVGQVRDRTTRPVILAARAIVFGLLAAILGLFALIILIVGLMPRLPSDPRMALLPRDRRLAQLRDRRRIVFLAGALMMAKRIPKEVLE